MADSINDVWGYIIAGFVGVLLAWPLQHLYFRAGRRSNELAWTIWSNNLVRDFTSKLSKIELRYAGRDVQTLTVSTVAIWNSGTETVYGSEIVNADPLSFESVSGVRILDVWMTKTNNEESDIELYPDDEGRLTFLNFDYLASGHGALFQVVHTGVGDLALAVTGKLRESRLVHKPEPSIASGIPRLPRFMRRWVGYEGWWRLLYLLAGVILPLASLPVLFSGTYPFGTDLPLWYVATGAILSFAISAMCFHASIAPRLARYPADLPFYGHELDNLQSRRDPVRKHDSASTLPVASPPPPTGEGP